MSDLISAGVELFRETIKKIPWPVLVLIIALVSWGAYAQISKQSLVAEVQKNATKEIGDKVAAVENDKDNLRIYYTDQVSTVNEKLCACRVNLARAEAIAPKFATKYPPRSVVQNPKPEPESCE